MSRPLAIGDGVLLHDCVGRSVGLAPLTAASKAGARRYKTRRAISRALEMIDGVRMHDRSRRSIKLQPFPATATGGGDDI